MGRPDRRRQAALRSARAGRARPVASGDGGEPIGVHPVHTLRARLPRRAGQRRDRPRLPRQRREDRLRHGRPDGQLHVRRLRRMRAGVPDRSADAGARRRADGPRQAGRIALPVLRRRLSADLQRQGQQDPLRRGSRRPRQPWAAVRQGPLWVRLCAPSAAFARAADPPPRRAQGCRRRDGPRARSRRLPRGDLGRGARARRRRPRTAARRARSQGARRLRLGQGQQRGGLPVPEAGPDRLSQQQRRPLHAAVPRIERRRAARRNRIGRGLEPGDGRRQGRGRHHHRRQPDRKPSGRVELDQERRGQRHQADRLRPASLRSRAPCAPLPAVQARHRRRAAQRDDARHRQRRPRRRGVHRQPNDRLRRVARQRRGLQPGGDGADLRHRRRHDPLCRTPVCHVARIDDPVGHGNLAARARHRQRPLPDRALADDGSDRPARYRAAPLARTEQRAGRLRRRPDTDDVPRLPARDATPRPARISSGPGSLLRTRSTTSRG